MYKPEPGRQAAGRCLDLWSVHYFLAVFCKCICLAIAYYDNIVARQEAMPPAMGVFSLLDPPICFRQEANKG